MATSRRTETAPELLKRTNLEREAVREQLARRALAQAISDALREAVLGGMNREAAAELARDVIGAWL